MFDPSSTLLGKDIKVEAWADKGEKIKVLKVWLKSPKEQKKDQGIMVEVFETKSEFCPVAAFEKWRQVSKVAWTKTKPAFRQEDGSLYTGKDFNVDLRSLLTTTRRKYWHILSGLALPQSWLRKDIVIVKLCALGVGTLVLFLCYVKLNRLRRMEISREITKRLSL